MDRHVDSSPSTPAPRLQVRRLIIGFSLLFILAALVTLGALFNIARILDRQEQERSTFQATQALEQRLQASRQFLSSYAVWDAAYQHLAGQVDWHWAYEEKNIGDSLYTASGYEGVFVVDDQRTTYALLRGKPTDSPASALIDGPLAAIITEARAAAPAREQVTQFVLLDGSPAVLSAAAVRPDKDVEPSEVDDAPVMLFVDELTGPKLSQLGKGAGLTDLHRKGRDRCPQPSSHHAGRHRLQPGLEQPATGQAIALGGTPTSVWGIAGTGAGDALPVSPGVAGLACRRAEPATPAAEQPGLGGQRAAFSRRR